MASKVTHLFDPRVPVGRVGFLVIQVLGSGIEGVLRNRMFPTGANTKVLFVACVLALAVILAIMTTKRLMDVGWSHRWAFVILGPVLFDILFGIGSSNSTFLKMAFYPLFVSYVGYMLLVVVLCVQQGQATGDDKESRPSKTYSAS